MYEIMDKYSLLYYGYSDNAVKSYENLAICIYKQLSENKYTFHLIIDDNYATGENLDKDRMESLLLNLYKGKSIKVSMAYLI